MMTPDSPQVTTDGQQAQTGGKVPTCYNCGDSGHYFDACPEPARKIPVGLAAAQAAKVSAGLQSHNEAYNGQDHRSKRQRTGAGPVVTRYPVPGPVVTKYGPPPTRHQPYGGQQGYNNISPQQFAQSQYGSQQQQPFPPHNAYIPYGYHQPPMPQAYNQYIHHPTAPHAQVYSPMPLQGQGYGYGPATGGSPFGQPYGQHTTYGQPVPPQHPQQTSIHYPQQHPHMPYHQQNMQQHLSYGPPQQPRLYQPGPYHLEVDQPNSYNLLPQYPQRQIQSQSPLPYQQSQGIGAQEYKGSRSCPNQQSQQWAQSPVSTQGIPIASGSSNNSDQSNAQTGKQPVREEFDGFPLVQSAQGLPINDELIQTAQSPQGYAAQKLITNTPNDTSYGQVNLSNGTKMDEFDIAWEESVFKDLILVSVIAILTPLSTKFDEEPLIVTSDTPIKSKYVRANNLEVFILPIQKSLHWATLQKDPALATIDEAYPAVPFDVWDEYQEERKKRKLLEVCAYDTFSQEGPWYETVQEDVDDQAMKENVRQDSTTQSMEHEGTSRIATRRHSVGSRHTNYRSSSRTPCSSRQETPDLEAEIDRRASRSGEAQVKRATSLDPAEALLASLGVTGAPKPVSINCPAQLLSSSTSIYNEGQKELMQQSSPRRQTRQDSGYSSSRPSIGRQSSWNNGLTFPPPKSTRLRSGYDGSADSPVSEGSVRSRKSGQDNDKSGPKSISPVESPLSPTSAALLGELPATHAEDRYLSREPLRQSDDHYVKKRPQPKVADAYSRRW